jgi:type II secretory pathway component PulF
MHLGKMLPEQAPRLNEENGIINMTLNKAPARENKKTAEKSPQLNSRLPIVGVCRFFSCALIALLDFIVGEFLGFILSLEIRLQDLDGIIFYLIRFLQRIGVMVVFIFFRIIIFFQI